MSAPKTSAPVVGFNHNVKYAGRVYHVQTEDSGLPHAHFITHLFVGGNIVSSIKSSYADNVADPDLAKLIRQLMEQQHKLMLKKLVGGEFNELAERLSATHYEPGVLASGQTGPSAVNTSTSAPMTAAVAAGSPAKAPPPRAQPAPEAPPPQAPPPPAPTLKPHTPSRLPAVPPLPKVPATAIPRLPRSPGAPIWQPAPPTKSPAAPAPRLPGAPLPSTIRAPPGPSRPAAPPRLAPGAPAQPAAARGAQLPPGRQPDGAARPAPQLFSDAVVEVPADDLPTLFAEELISEKSLDEVILAFLSTDGEPK